LKQNKINKEMPYYLYIHNIYLYQYHDTKPNPINIDWLLGLTPTTTISGGCALTADLRPNKLKKLPRVSLVGRTQRKTLL